MNRLEKRQLKPHWLQRRRRLLGGEEVGGFAGGGIPEAPLTGGPFGRYQESWVEVPPEAPKDGQTYGRNNDAWVLIVGGGGGIDQATADARYVNIDGDIMTGHLGLPINPSASQAVRKDYVDGAITTGVSGKADKTYVDTQDALSVLKAGSTMSGFLTLHADPDTAMKAATKQYVDNKVALGGAEISDTAPTAAQGKLWWESDAGGLWLSYNDGNTTQWIGVGGNVAQGNYVSKAGDTITGNISITSPTASGTPTSGALVVTGGVGIGGALNIAGAVNHNSTTQLGDTLTLFNAGPQIILDRLAITGSNTIRGRITGLDKWAINLGSSDAMSGGNVGANFYINRYADTTGAFLDSPVVVYRDTGRVNLASNTASTSPTTGALTVGGGIGVGGAIHAAGDLNIYQSPDAIFRMSHPAAGYNYIIGQRNSTNRWAIILGDAQAEAGSNTGSDFQLQRYSDAGNGIGGAIWIRRDNANIQVTGSLSFAAAATVQPGMCSIGRTSVALLLNGGTDGYVFNNYDNSANLLTINNTGQCVFRSAGSVVSSVNTAVKIGFPGGGIQYAISFRNNTALGGYMQWFVNSADGVVGSISTTDTNTGFNTASDGRLKEDLQSFDAGHIVDETEVYNFAWKSTGERSYGMIAQQANEVYPTAVSYAEREDAWFIDYSKYVPVMMQELKSLRDRIAKLEVR